MTVQHSHPIAYWLLVWFAVVVVLWMLLRAFTALAPYMTG